MEALTPTVTLGFPVHGHKRLGFLLDSHCIPSLSSVTEELLGDMGTPGLGPGSICFPGSTLAYYGGDPWLGLGCPKVTPGDCWKALWLGLMGVYVGWWWDCLLLLLFCLFV